LPKFQYSKWTPSVLRNVSPIIRIGAPFDECFLRIQRGKDEALKGIKKDHSDGIVSRTRTPLGKDEPVNVKNMDWGQIGDLADEYAQEAERRSE